MSSREYFVCAIVVGLLLATVPAFSEEAVKAPKQPTPEQLANEPHGCCVHVIKKECVPTSFQFCDVGHGNSVFAHMKCSHMPVSDCPVILFDQMKAGEKVAEVKAGDGTPRCFNPGCQGPSVTHSMVIISFNNFRWKMENISINDWYSIFSELEVQMNGQVKGLEVVTDGVKDIKPFLGRVGFRWMRDRIDIKAGLGSLIEVSLNGVPLQLRNTSTSIVEHTLDETRVRLSSRRHNYPDYVEVSTPKLGFAVNSHGHHLDLMIRRVAPGLCSVNGLMGQLYTGKAYNPMLRPGSMGLKRQGADTDFKVSDIFATDDKFNRWGVRAKKCDVHHNAGVALLH